MLLAARIGKEDLERPVDHDRKRAIVVARADDDVSRAETQQLTVVDQSSPVVLAAIGQEDEVVPRRFRPRIGEVLGKTAGWHLGGQAPKIARLYGFD
jgi:hypothetical protein